jgi:hypothetical protein
VGQLTKLHHKSVKVTIRIKQGSRCVGSRHTAYITILAALFDRIIMAVSSEDRRNPQQDRMGLPQGADAYAICCVSRCKVANKSHAAKGLKVNGHGYIIYKHPLGHIITVGSTLLPSWHHFIYYAETMSETADLTFTNREILFNFQLHREPLLPGQPHYRNLHKSRQ